MRGIAAGTRDGIYRLHRIVGNRYIECVECLGFIIRQIRMFSHFLVNDDEKPQSLLSEISSDDMNGIIK